MTASASSAAAPSSSVAARKVSPWGPLVAVALGAAGLGFAMFVYTVPYRRAARDLKMARGDLMQAQAAVAGLEREMTQLKGDLVKAQQAAGEALVRVRSETAVLRLQLQEQVKAAPEGAVDVQVDSRGVMVKLAADFVFEGGGAALSKEGGSALKAMGRAIGKAASRVVVTAPLGRTRLPAEVAQAFAKPEALVAERVRAVVQALSQAGVPSAVIWGVSTGGPDGGKEPSVALEIAPGA